MTILWQPAQIGSKEIKRIERKGTSFDPNEGMMVTFKSRLHNLASTLPKVYTHRWGICVYISWLSLGPGCTLVRLRNKSILILTSSLFWHTSHIHFSYCCRSETCMHEIANRSPSGKPLARGIYFLRMICHKLCTCAANHRRSKEPLASRYMMLLSIILLWMSCRKLCVCTENGTHIDKLQAWSSCISQISPWALTASGTVRS